MTTYFDTVSKSFVDVPITDEGVDTVAFLEASEGVVKLFDLFGAAAFTVVQSDLRGNITKVRTYYEAHQAEANTLEKLVESEKGQKKRTATEGLMWLLRGLHFTLVGLQRSYEDQAEELSVSFNKSYEVTLRQYHSFVVRPVFALAMKACPYRADFYQKLGEPPEKVNEELKKWMDALDNIVQRMQAFYEKGAHSKGL